MQETSMPDKIVREPQALYAVLQDKDALKHGPIFIEQDGEAAAVVLSIERYRELIGEAQPERWIEQQLVDFSLKWMPTSRCCLN